MSETIYDITPVISEHLAVFPGDTSPVREVLMDIARGDHLTLSTWRSTVHVGAHVDAPSHYSKGAATIDAVDLEWFVGPVQVIRVPARGRQRVGVDDLRCDVVAHRVLIATGTYPDPTRFDDDFAALAPDLIDWLGDRGVKLVGIDTPSVDLADSQDLPAHHACLRNEMYILEGIVLDGVPAACYELIALPLKLSGFDASPVRAILRTTT